MNIDRAKLEKLFDEHFIDEPSSEVFDAMNEIIDYAEKAVKLFAIPDVSNLVCQHQKRQWIPELNKDLCLNCGTLI